MPSLDSSDYHKLVISIGAALVAASVIVPWLVLRDMSALLVTQNEIEALTPVAQQAVQEKQSHHQWFAENLFWVFAVPTVLGMVLVAYAANNLRQLQPDKDDKIRADGKRARAEIGRQTEQETKEKAKSDAEQDEFAASGGAERSDAGGDGDSDGTQEEADHGTADTPKSNERDESDEPETRGGPEPRPVRVESREVRLRSTINERQHRLIRAEERVLDVVDRMVPDGWTLRRRVRVDTGGRKLLVDGLLSRHANKKSGDVLIEVAFASSLPGIQRKLESVMALLFRYREMVDKDAIAWIVWVVDADLKPEPGGMTNLTAIMNSLSRIPITESSSIVSTIVREAEIEKLEFPDIV